MNKGRSTEVQQDQLQNPFYKTRQVTGWTFSHMDQWLGATFSLVLDSLLTQERLVHFGTRASFTTLIFPFFSFISAVVFENKVLINFAKFKKVPLISLPSIRSKLTLEFGGDWSVEQLLVK